MASAKSGYWKTGAFSWYHQSYPNRYMKKIPSIKTFLVPLLAFGSLLLFASCETTDYDDDDDDHDDHDRRGRTTTTTTEETVLRNPYVGGPVSSTVQTQTTQTR